MLLIIFVLPIPYVALPYMKEIMIMEFHIPKYICQFYHVHREENNKHSN